MIRGLSSRPAVSFALFSSAYLSSIWGAACGKEPCSDAPPAITVEIEAAPADISASARSLQIGLKAGAMEWTRTYDLGGELGDGSTSIAVSIVPAPTTSFPISLEVLAFSEAGGRGALLGRGSDQRTVSADACNRLRVDLGPAPETGDATVEGLDGGDRDGQAAPADGGADAGSPDGGAAAPSQLAFLSPPQRLPAGECSAAVTIESRDASGIASPVMQRTFVSFSANPSTGVSFFLDPACADSLTRLVLDPGQSAASFHFIASTRGTLTLGVSAAGLAPATQEETIDDAIGRRIAFANAPRTTIAGDCSSPLNVELRDSAGAPLPASTITRIALTASALTGFSFYADAACATSLGNLSIPTGETSATFHYRGTAAGSVTLTASSSGYGSGTQAASVTAAEASSFTWDPISGPQIEGIAFSVTIRARDNFGNIASAFSGSALLSASPAEASVSCATACASIQSTTPFTRGEWSGDIALSPAGAGRHVRASSGNISGVSDTFEVIAQPAAEAPPLARLSVSPAAVPAGGTVAFDASSSSDYGTLPSNLEVSWDFAGTATTPPPWTPWTTSKTTSTVFSTPGVYTPRLAVRDSAGNIGYGAATVGVAPAPSQICVVNTTNDRDDGALSCAGPYGSDGALSLGEAIRISNATQGVQFVTFGGVLSVAASNANLAILNITDDVEIIAPSGLTTNAYTLDVASGVTALISGVEMQNLQSQIKVRPGATLAARDIHLHDSRGFEIDGTLALDRSLLVNCAVGPLACVEFSAPTSNATIRHTHFRDVSGTAIQLSMCTPSGSPALNLQSSTLVRAQNAVLSRCSGTMIIRHNTFHANATGVAYTSNAASAGHVLANNIFSANTTAAVTCGAATFTRRDHQVLFQNASDGCLSADPQGLITNPLYILETGNDFRIGASSAARDSAFPLGIDVNGVAPGAFFGGAPDRGGIETW